MVPFLWESSSETIGMVSSLLKDAIFSFSAKVQNVNSILTGCTQWTTLIRVRVGLSAKRLGGHLKKDKIIFQSSSQACCSPLQSQKSQTICTLQAWIAYLKFSPKGNNFSWNLKFQWIDLRVLTNLKKVPYLRPG